MRGMTGILAALLVLWTGVAFGDDVEGVVRGAGTGPAAYTLLGQPDGGGSRLCDGDFAKRVRKLAGLTVRVTGTWQLDGGGKPKCVEGTAFVPLKSSSGKDLVVGVLGQKDGGWSLTREDGTVVQLAEVPASLKKLSGKKVIVSLNAVAKPALKDPGQMVVTHIEFP